MQPSWIVAGWYTPDYRHWWNKLRKQLDMIGAPHDFVEVRKEDGGWEINTMRKAGQVLAAMDRHPDKTIIFLDVDCSVPGGYAGLAKLAQINRDVGLYFRTKWSRRGKSRSGARSGTMVLRPTLQARAFVAAWVAETSVAPRYAVDQDSLAVALGRAPDLSVTYLDVKYCAVRADKCPDPVIFHDSASLHTKTGKFTKLFSKFKLAA